MGITGGFGTVMDFERGVSRQWVMGGDGIKRWADSGQRHEFRFTQGADRWSAGMIC